MAQYITFYVRGLSGKTAKRKVLDTQQVIVQPSKGKRYKSENYLVLINGRHRIIPKEAVIKSSRG